MERLIIERSDDSLVCLWASRTFDGEITYLVDEPSDSLEAGCVESHSYHRFDDAWTAYLNLAIVF